MIWKVILYMNETYSAIKGGRRYFGEMKNNLEHGLGFYDIELWNQKFVGEFLNDKATGIGLKIQGSGTDWERKIVCEFNNNSHEGIGMYKWPSGATYVGEFKDDRAYGMGCFRIWIGNNYFGKIKHVTSLSKVIHGGIMKIDSSTLSNLEIFTSISNKGLHGTLINTIDNTLTPMGSRLLKQHLSKPLLSTKKINYRLKMISEYIKNHIKAS